MSKAWFRQRERGSPLLILFILWVARRLGRVPARVLLWPISAYFLLAAGNARRASRDYLSRLRGRPAGLVQVARHIHCFAATILDRVFFLSGRFDVFDIHYHGLENLNNKLADGRGVLLLGAHLGSFEVLRALAIQQSRLRLKVLMYPDHNPYLTGLLDRLNPEVANSVIPLGGPDALLAVKETLDQGMAVGMLGDRVAPGDRQTRCPFLDQPTVFPVGPAHLASVLQVPVVLVFGLYRGANRYDLYLEAMPSLPVVPRAEREAAAAAWMGHYATRLEHYTRLAPYNWFNFYDYWQS